MIDSVYSDGVYRGTWLSDPLQERFGRRPALFIAAIFCVALVIGTTHLPSKVVAALLVADM
jgi:membrane protease YdiL (CAAX protease family)